MNHAPGLEELLAEGRLSELHEPAVRYLRPRLRRLLAARFLPASLLDDAMQDTFVRVLRYHAGYRPGVASARTWLMVLARSAVADMARRHNARKTRSLFGRDGELLFDVAANGMPAEPARAVAVIEEALAPMPAHHTEAVRMRLEGRGQKEVADRLGLTPGNVGVIYHHFRRRVEGLLGR